MASAAPARSVEAASPTAVLGAAAAVVWGACAWSSGGFGSGTLAIAGTTLVVLLGLGVVSGWRELAVPSGARGLAFASLGCLVAWTWASIAWAHFPAEAVVGAQRATIYAVGFAMFGLLPISNRSIERVLGMYVAALSVVALGTAVAAIASPSEWFSDGRLQRPTDYINATVALWMLGFWPACHLASRSASSPLVRAAAAAAATAFLGMAALGQSRAWLYVSIGVAAVLLLLSPLRTRILCTLIIVSAALAIAWHPLVRVYSQAQHGELTRSTVSGALGTLAAAIVVAALLTATWAVVERSGRLSQRATHRLLVAFVAAVALTAGVVVVRHRASLLHPYRWADTRWRSFADSETATSGNTRFLASFGSDRYQEWRIAWAAFRSQPITGIGAENYADVYLLHRRDALHEPSFPHSIPLGLLSQLGLVGVALAAAFAGSAVVCAWRRLREPDGGAVAAALAVPAYWLAHGSFDWFFEFPALAGPALGFLGLTVAPSAVGAAKPLRASIRRGTAAVGAALGAAVVLTLAATAVADALANSAAAGWQSDPARSYRLLHLTSKLDPLSAQPLLLAGSIALDRRDYGRARHLLGEATTREPRNWYAWFQLALADAGTRQWAKAAEAIGTARGLDPRDPVVLLAQTLIRSRRPSVGALNSLYVNESRYRFGLSTRPH